MSVGLDLSTKSFKKGIKSAQGHLTGLKNSLGAIKPYALGIGAAIGASATAFAGWGLKLAAELEQAETAFATMLGSVSAAKATLADLSQFAASTPFALDELRGAAQQLLAFGIAQDELMPKMKVLGDIAAGTGKPIGELAAIFGKVRATGKVGLESLTQLAERSVPIFSVLAEQMGVTEGALLSMVSRGEVGVGDLEQALESITSTGGVFNNAMEKQSTTLSGLWSTLKDNVAQVALALGQELLPYAKAAVDTLLQMVNGFNSSGQSAATMSTVVSEGFGWIVKAIALAADVVHTLYQAFKFLQAGVTKAISLTLIPLDYLYRGITELANFLGANVDTTFFKTVREELDNLAAEQWEGAVDEFVGKTWGEQFTEAADKIKSGAEATKQALEETAKATDEVAQSTSRMTEEQIKAATNAAKLIEKLSEERDFLKSGFESQELYRLSKEGVNESIIAEAQALQKEIDQINESKKAQDDMQSAIEQTVASTRTPLEEFKERVNELYDQLEAGLPQEAYDRAIKQAQEKLKAELPEEESGEPQLAGLALAGSAAARSTILRNQLGDPNKKMQEVNEEQLAEQKKQTAEMRKLVAAQTDSFITVKF